MAESRLLTDFFSGDRVSLARMISRAENDRPVADPILDQVFRRVRGAHRIGITGPPGAGKSTIVDGLITRFRRLKKGVGVIAVDPTSPFTGGALLGDRIRMRSSHGDSGVFIRSMATRGGLGGLAHTTQEAADVMDAFGFEAVILETVGVGQSELDIVEAADTVIVVLVPESGDSIQAMKAGLMEIGDIFVLNKSDHENARQAFMELKSVLSLNPVKQDWQLPLIQTVAHEMIGMDKLFELILSHQDYLQSNGRFQRKQQKRIRKRLKMKIENRLHHDFWDQERRQLLEKLVQTIFQGKITYSQALKQLFADEGS